MLAYAEEEAKRRGMVAVFLDSRPEAFGFFSNQGYGPHTATLVRKLLQYARRPNQGHETDRSAAD